MDFLSILFEPSFWILRILFFCVVYIYLAGNPGIQPKLSLPPNSLIWIIGVCWLTGGALLQGIGYQEKKGRMLLAAGFDLVPATLFTSFFPGPASAFGFLLPFLDTSLGESSLFGYLLVLAVIELFTLGAGGSFAHADMVTLSMETLALLFCLMFARYVLKFYQQSRRSNTLFSLIEVGQSLGATLKMENVIASLENVVSTLYHFNAFVLYLADEGDRMARIKVNRSPLPAAFTDFSLDRPSLFLDVLKKGQGMIIPDVRPLRDPFMPTLASFRSAAILPLQLEGPAFGLFVLMAPTRKYFEEADLRILQIIANQVAVSVRNVMVHEQAASMAITDSLTGLYTHGYFQKIINEIVPEQLRLQKPISVLMMDLDGFKQVNDTFGHPAGDHVVVHAARVIKNLLTSQDILARYGGDEFVAVISNSSKVIAAALAERIRTAIEDLRFPVIGRSVRISASVGVASAPEDATSAHDLVEAADKAMYRAKQSGRNRTALAGPDIKGS